MEATTMITELIRDNRKVIDRIPREEIDRIVMLVKQHKVNCLLYDFPTLISVKPIEIYNM